MNISDAAWNATVNSARKVIHRRAVRHLGILVVSGTETSARNLAVETVEEKIFWATFGISSQVSDILDNTLEELL